MKIIQNFAVHLQNFLELTVQAVTKIPKTFVCIYTVVHIIFHIKALKLLL